MAGEQLVRHQFIPETEGHTGELSVEEAYLVVAFLDINRGALPKAKNVDPLSDLVNLVTRQARRMKHINALKGSGDLTREQVATNVVRRGQALEKITETLSSPDYSDLRETMDPLSQKVYGYIELIRESKAFEEISVYAKKQANAFSSEAEKSSEDNVEPSLDTVSGENEESDFDDHTLLSQQKRMPSAKGGKKKISNYEISDQNNGSTLHAEEIRSMIFAIPDDLLPEVEGFIPSGFETFIYPDEHVASGSSAYLLHLLDGTSSSHRRAYDDLDKAKQKAGIKRSLGDMLANTKKIARKHGINVVSDGVKGNKRPSTAYSEYLPADSSEASSHTKLNGDILAGTEHIDNDEIAIQNQEIEVAIDNRRRSKSVVVYESQRVINRKK